jgi:hypothetical protein
MFMTQSLLLGIRTMKGRPILVAAAVIGAAAILMAFASSRADAQTAIRTATDATTTYSITTN